MPETTDRRSRWLLMGISALLVSLPSLLVTFPPSIDLPQHVAQVRLAIDALHDPSGPYRIQWLTPYSALVGLFWIIWRVVGPLGTGHVGLVVLGVAWTAAVHWLAARRGRPAESAVLASTLYLGFSLYRGFASFLLGWIPFLFWFDLTSRPTERLRRSELIGLPALLLFIYACHGIWFGVALGWMFLSLLIHRPPWQVAWVRIAIVLPVVALAAFWWSHANRSVSYSLQWFQSPLLRLTPMWWWRSAFGGLKGETEPLMLAALIAWCVAGLWTSRKGLRASSDPAMLIMGAVFALGGIFLPSGFSIVLYAAERLAGPALLFLVLALPAPRLPSGWRRAVAIGVLTVYCGLVTLSWKLFEQTDLAGLQAAVTSVPDGVRVLGLDFLQTSDIIAGRPFTHEVVYAQALHGGMLANSFAEGSQPFVVLKRPVEKKWTPAVEYYSERVQPSDLSHFDYVVVGAPEDLHKVLPMRLPMTPVTSDGLWRLYRVRR